MNEGWERLWDAINDAFVTLAESLQSVNPELWWTCAHAENAVFPFWAYASFSAQGIPGEEDVVIAISFKSTENSLHFTCDISRGNGEILADGPSGSTTVTSNSSELQAWAARKVTEALTFIEVHFEILRKELRRQTTLPRDLH